MPIPDKNSLIDPSVTNQQVRSSLAIIVDFLKTIEKQSAVFATTELLLSSVPEGNPSYAKTLDTGKVYLWDGAWKETGLGELEQAKKYTDNAIAGLSAEYNVNVPITPIFGYAINSAPQDSLFTPGISRAYLKLDVSTTKKIIVSGATQLVPAWKWVFCDQSNNYLATSPNYGNGEFLVPQEAKWAYRTWQVGDKNIYENEGMTITGILASTIKDALEIESEKILNEAEEDVDSKVYGITKSVVNLNVIQGFGVQTTPGNPRILVAQSKNDVRAHIKIDVRHSSHLKVSNTIENSALATWYWVFETDDGGKILTPYNFNVEFDIPENVIYAYRTVFYSNASSSYDDIANGLKVTVQKRLKPIQPQIDTLAADIAAMKTASTGGGMPKAYSSLVEKMLDMFNKKSFISPNDFADETQTERIKSAVAFVKKRGFGIIELAVDKQTNTNLWTVTEAITLPSNCWIYINKSIVKRGDGVFDNIFRNEGIVPDPNPFNYAKELNPNENILIFGNSKADSFIDGNLAGAKVAPHPVTGGAPVPWVSDWYGWRAISILFANTQHHHVFDLSVINSQSWSISNEHGCSNFSYHDLYFNTTVKNGDGVNVRFGCYDFEIYNIDGRTSDDTVAINSLNNFLGQHPQGRYIFPTQVGGYADRGLGKDIYDGEVYNIKASSSAGVSCYLSGGSKLYDLNFNNISELTGKSMNWMFQIDGSYGGSAVLGDCYNITVNNVTSEATPKAVKLNAPIKDCWINNVTQNNKEATVPAVSKEARYIEENVVITNVKEPT